jgi:hypothetical protein
MSWRLVGELWKIRVIFSEQNPFQSSEDDYSLTFTAKKNFFLLAVGKKMWLRKKKFFLLEIESRADFSPREVKRATFFWLEKNCWLNKEKLMKLIWKLI